VAKTITKWGVKGQYFLDEDEAQILEAELTHILLNQMAAFNSPVWFNVGVEDRPQCSACFINSVKDDMRSIMALAMTEGMLFQNANHSVRVTDDFMHAVTDNKEWQTHYITNHKVADTYKARDLMRQMAEAAYICGDPGIQFDTTVNEWNPCSNTDRINASNPCSEYMFLDDSACNLASLNLMKFRTPEGEFDVDSF